MADGSGALVLVTRVVAVLAALFLLDRLLLAAEARGWIYWRRRKASPGSLGNALLSAQALLQPEVRHVVEERSAVRKDEEGKGEPPGLAGDGGAPGASGEVGEDTTRPGPPGRESEKS